METKKILPLRLASLDEANGFVEALLNHYKCPRSDNLKAQLFVE